MAQPGIVTIDPDTCIGSALQLEGEKSIHSPSVNKELHAAPSGLKFFSFIPSFPSPSDTLAHDSPCGEGAANEQRATDHCPERLKLPDLYVEYLEAAGEAWSTPDDAPVLPGDLGSAGDLNSPGLACTVGNTDARKVEPSGVDVHKREGALLVVDNAPAWPRIRLASSLQAGLLEFNRAELSFEAEL